MPKFREMLLWGLLLGPLAAAAAGQEVPDDLEGEAWEKAQSEAAEKGFAAWKETGTAPDDFLEHVQFAGRPDLLQRQTAGDRMTETEIKPESPAKNISVTLHDRVPVSVEGKSSDSTPVWRRITSDRFEIWTPTEGRLFDAAGKRLATAKVTRGDGWGREWYGAFLPDGRWVTTDLDNFDRRLTMFSAKGKRGFSIPGGKLIPDDSDEGAALIGWARSDQTGKAWIVSVGSEGGRGWVRVTPDGKWSKVDCPWRECFPQQLGKRGFYIELKNMSDDGAATVTRAEAGHGPSVGWPNYGFPGGASVVVPEGGRFWILPKEWSVSIESAAGRLSAEPVDRKDETVWFFDTAGKYQHWLKGGGLGASIITGGLWIRLLDDSCLRVDPGYEAKAHLVFTSAEKKTLVPVEIHDDIGLGLFQQGGELVLGTWAVGN